MLCQYQPALHHTQLPDSDGISVASGVGSENTALLTATVRAKPPWQGQIIQIGG